MIRSIIMFIIYELTDFVYELRDASEIFLFEEISFKYD